MAKSKSNGELAVEFVESLKGQGIDIFKENHAVAGGFGQQEFLYVLPVGQAGGNTSFDQLCLRILQWLQQQEIVKSPIQVKNIAKVVVLNAEDRKPNPHD